MKSMMLIGAIVIASVLVLPSTHLHAVSTLEATITEYMAATQYYDETTAEEKVREWGTECVPILIQMLDAAPGDDTERTAFFLGKTRNPAAVKPLIEYVSKLRSLGNDSHFGYLALGRIGSDTALEFLAEAAKDPFSFAQAVHGLEVAGSPAALNLLEKCVPEDEAQGKILSYSTATLRDALQREEGLRRAHIKGPPYPDAAQKFWESQSSLAMDATREIIGDYTGTAYWAGYSEVSLDAVRIVFHSDGTYETNFGPLTELRQDPQDLRRDQPALLPTLSRGVYKVLGPTQLILGPGLGVTTHGLTLGDRKLSFYHRSLGAFFSLGTPSAQVSSLAGTDFAGVYKGTAFIAEQGSSQIRKVSGIELVFTDNGFFETNFGSDHGKIMTGFQRMNGRYVIDAFGKLICYTNFQGGDYFGESTNWFFDWEYRDGKLFVNYYGPGYDCALVLSVGAEPVPPNSPEFARQLRGTYAGAAYVATPDENIKEIPGIVVNFSDDGTYTGLSSEALHPGNQNDPDSAGPFVILSNRHIYMADQGICDVLVSGDELYFTSLKLNAYFVLRRVSE